MRCVVMNCGLTRGSAAPIGAAGLCTDGHFDDVKASMRRFEGGTGIDTE